MKAAVASKPRAQRKPVHTGRKPERGTSARSGRGAAAGVPLFLQRSSAAAVPSLQRQEESAEEVHEESLEEGLVQASHLSAPPPPLQRREEDEEQVVKGLPEGVQPKLSVGRPGDVFEQEADRVAERVMRMPEPAAASAERCPECERDQQVPASVQAKADGASPPAPPASIANTIRSPSGGAPLSGAVSSRVESVLGQDLSPVRVHTDAEAGRAAKALSAKAFTYQNHIWLGSGQSASDDRLMAHEAAHVVQQGYSGGRVSDERPTDGGSVSSGALPPSHRQPTEERPRIRRFAASEHKELGDVTGQDVDLGNGVVLSWGEVVALAGDHFGSLDDLRDAASTEAGKRQIRAALEHAGIAGPHSAAATLPAPTAADAAVANERYIRLAAVNVSHFGAGGTALASYRRYHSEAIEKAIAAGLLDTEISASDLQDAYASEAFGQHFLTDLFSAGHVRVPRAEILEWYSAFAPTIVDRLIRSLRERLVDELYAQAARQSRGARIFEGRARSKIRANLQSKIDKGLAELGGREVMVSYLGMALAGIVSGMLHDQEGERGVNVSSGHRPEGWRTVGDDRLDESPETREEAEMAVRAGLADVQQAYQLAAAERANRFEGEDFSRIPTRVHFGFDSDQPASAAGELSAAANHLIYNPTSRVEVVGHACPIGNDPYNDHLSARRAEQVARALVAAGASPESVTTNSSGRAQPITSDPRQYHLNRRVEFLWSSHAPEGSTTPDADEIMIGRALTAVRATVGPPFRNVEQYIPEAVAGVNPPLPEWRWGQLSPATQTEIGGWVRNYLTAELQAKLLSSAALDPVVEDDITFEPRPVARRILTEVLADPVAFLAAAMGRVAGP